LSVGGEVESDSDRESEVLHRVEVHAEPRDSDSRSQMQRHRDDVHVNQSTNTQSWFVGLDGQVSADVTRGRSSNRTNRMRTRSMSRREQTPTGEVELHTKRRSNVNNGNEVVSRARREALLERSNNANMEAKKTIIPAIKLKRGCYLEDKQTAIWLMMMKGYKCWRMETRLNVVNQKEKNNWRKKLIA